MKRGINWGVGELVRHSKLQTHSRWRTNKSNRCIIYQALAQALEIMLIVIISPPHLLTAISDRKSSHATCVVGLHSEPSASKVVHGTGHTNQYHVTQCDAHIRSSSRQSHCECRVARRTSRASQSSHTVTYTHTDTHTPSSIHTHIWKMKNIDF